MKMILLCLCTILLALPQEVIFMRHANKDDKLPTDTKVKANWKKPLTQDGLDDAKNIQLFLQKYMREYKESEIVIYSSPFRRAISTIACFAKAAGKKIKLDRSLGEADITVLGVTKTKTNDNGVWDPTFEKEKKEEYDCEDNKCFMKGKCTSDKTLEGNLGPNCDTPIRDVLKHCDLAPSKDSTSLNIIDKTWKQKTDLSKTWYGTPGWKNEAGARADYVWEHIIQTGKPNQRFIIVSHGTFMQTFFYKYVENSRAELNCPWKLGFATCAWNSGTMNFLRANPIQGKRPLLAVGERFSFASTNDMLWLNQIGCKADQDTEFEYARDKWFPGTYMKSKDNKAKLLKIARKGEMVSGLVLGFDKYCPGKDTQLEYMDCTRRFSDNGSPICLLAGWYSLGGYKCFGRPTSPLKAMTQTNQLVMNSKDSTSAKWLQESFDDPNRGNGFWIKVREVEKRGLENIKGGCEMQSSSIVGVRHGWVGVLQYRTKKGGDWQEKITSPQRSEAGAQQSIRNFLKYLKTNNGKVNRRGYGKKMKAGKMQVMSKDEQTVLKQRQDERKEEANKAMGITSGEANDGASSNKQKQVNPNSQTSEEANGGASSRKRSGSFVAASNLPESSNTASRLAFFFFGAFIFLGMYAVYSKSISKEESYYSLLNTNGDGSEL